MVVTFSPGERFKAAIGLEAVTAGLNASKAFLINYLRLKKRSSKVRKMYTKSFKRISYERKKTIRTKHIIFIGDSVMLFSLGHIFRIRS